MASRNFTNILFLVLVSGAVAVPTGAQSFRVQCPTSTITHPANSAMNSVEPAYSGPTAFKAVPVTGTTGGYLIPSANVNGAIKCQQVSGGDGYSTMANGTQTFMFSFGPLSGLADIASGPPGTEFPSVFNMPYPGTSRLAILPRRTGWWRTLGPAIRSVRPGLQPERRRRHLRSDIANVVTIYDIAEATGYHAGIRCRRTLRWVCTAGA